MKLVGFRDFLFKEHPCKMEYFTLRGNCYSPSSIRPSSAVCSGFWFSTILGFGYMRISTGPSIFWRFSASVAALAGVI